MSYFCDRIKIKIVMTRKIIMLLVLTMVSFGTMFAGNTVLPLTAQKFIKQHFNGQEVVNVKQDYDDGKLQYEVRLSGALIDFTADGQWLKVKAYSGVPKTILPNGIKNYVATHFRKQTIVKIEKKRKGYKVELDNDQELIFDAQGNFVRFDD